MAPMKVVHRVTFSPLHVCVKCISRGEGLTPLSPSSSLLLCRPAEVSRGWEGHCSSVILHPAVLLDESVDHLLHSQVGDQLVLGQRTPGDRVEMSHSL